MSAVLALEAAPSRKLGVATVLQMPKPKVAPPAQPSKSLPEEVLDQLAEQIRADGLDRDRRKAQYDRLIEETIDEVRAVGSLLRGYDPEGEADAVRRLMAARNALRGPLPKPSLLQDFVIGQLEHAETLLRSDWSESSVLSLTTHQIRQGISGFATSAENQQRKPIEGLVLEYLKARPGRGRQKSGARGKQQVLNALFVALGVPTGTSGSVGATAKRAERRIAKRK